MSSNMIKSKNIWVPERAHGVCVYFTSKDEALSEVQIKSRKESID